MNRSSNKTETVMTSSSEEEVVELFRQNAESIKNLETSSSAKALVKKIRVLLKDHGDILNFKKLRTAIIGNITLQPLTPYLEAQCLRASVDPDFFFGGYNFYINEMADPESKLYRFDPKMTFLFLDPKILMPELHPFFFDIPPEKRLNIAVEKINQIKALAKNFLEASNSLLIVSEFLPPRYPKLGIYDQREPAGERAVVRELNDRLEEWEHDMPNQVFRLDLEKVLAECGRAVVSDEKMRYLAKMEIPEKALPELAKEMIRFIRPALGLTKKCLVLDLDNTLWGGILGEDGIEGIQLGNEPPGNAFYEFQGVVKDLQRRGVILAINSKNDFELVKEAFDRHPDMRLKFSDFASVRANWNDKAQNMREIAQELNIGLDSFVYMDDNPAERLLIRQQIPEILTIEMPEDFSDYSLTLLELDAFEVLTLTEEDRKRTKLYQADSKRRELKTQITNLDEYLKSLNILVEVYQASDFAIPRIAQLTQRTNQFNLTTRRYKEANVRSFSDSPDARVYYVKSSDRFGNYGIVGACIMRIEEFVWEFDTLLLSCRVVGRGIEQAFLHSVFNQAVQNDARKLLGRYVPTRKNNLVSQFYSEQHFVVVSRSDQETVYEFDLKEKMIPLPKHIQLKTPQ